MKGIIIIVLVIGVLIGGLLTLRSSRNVGMPSDAVIDRAKKRARAQADAEKDAGED
jgi:hypothetical protein